MLGPPKVLLVGLDPLHDGTILIDRAKELAHRFGAALVLYDCVQNEYVSKRYFPDPGALSHARQSLVRRHRERLQRLAQPLIGDGLEVDAEAAWDAPLDEGIIRAARRRGADWILVGIGYHPVHRLPFLAGTDWQLIRHSPVPLLLVQPRPWSMPLRVIAAVDPLHEHGKPEDLDRRILEAGACLCRHGGGQLHVFHAFEPILRGGVDDTPEPLAVEFAEANLEGAHNAAVEALLGGLPEAVGNVRLSEGRAEDKLPEFAKEIGADVVVMGAVTRKPLRRIFIGSTAEKVLDRLVSDILIIKPAGFREPIAASPIEPDSVFEDG